jgi:S-disulfanyl-L-cysteine oxidoreductase SoxD
VKQTVRTLAVGIGLLGVLAPVVLGHSQARTVWDGVYSDEQAERGKAQYAGTCASCHGQALSGSDVAPALAGDAFRSNWGGATLADLFGRLRSTMPAGNPGSLSERAYVDLIAFLLKSNTYPAGQDELGSKSDVLQSITIQEKK